MVDFVIVGGTDKKTKGHFGLQNRSAAKSGSYRSSSSAKLLAVPGVDLDRVLQRIDAEAAEARALEMAPCYEYAVRDNLQKYLRQIRECIVILQELNWPHESFQARLDQLMPDIAKIHEYCPQLQRPLHAAYGPVHYLMLPKTRVDYIDAVMNEVERLQKDLDAAKDHVSDITTYETFLAEHGDDGPRKLHEIGSLKNSIVLEVIAFASNPAPHYHKCRKLLAEAKEAVLDHKMSVARDHLLVICRVIKWHRRVDEFKRNLVVLEAVA